MKITLLFTLLLGVMLNAGAQLLLKAGATKISDFTFTWANILSLTTYIVANPYIIFGCVLYVVSVFLWLVVLSRIEVSVAYPMLSLGYIMNAIAGYYLFHENLSLTRIVGILIILSGVYLVARS